MLCPSKQLTGTNLPFTFTSYTISRRQAGTLQCKVQKCTPWALNSELLDHTIIVKQTYNVQHKRI